MPASPSVNRNKALLIGLALLAVVVVVIWLLPASLLARTLPLGVHADDFSGTVWHGSADSVRVNDLNCGAVEWHVHPAALFTLALDADLHWVKGSLVADGALRVTRQGVHARHLEGGGGVEDLRDFGVPPGWRGTLHFDLQELDLAFAGDTVLPRAVVGTVAVTGLNSPQFAEGAELGSYLLKLADAAITPDADPAAELTDTGGPLAARGVFHYVVKEARIQFSGTVQERPDASPALRKEITKLEDLSARDAQGRIPVDFEFTL